MRKLLIILLALLLSVSTSQEMNAAEGWPANYQGVMLQGFYWDSYNDTKWTNLESQADELSQYFSLIWVPQSGWCNTDKMQMGYSDIWWFNQRSCFGTESELKSMINTFREKGLLTIADVVINHKNGNTNWCDFPTETWKGQTMTWSLADICQNDEAKNHGYNVTGAKDTGSNFDGCRDLDHTSPNVQKNIKLYLRFLQEEMGYAGFRYDMTGGYAPQYTKMYNESANPAFSVGEYWMDDGLNGLKKWIDGTGKTSAAFDFQLKWLINDAFGKANWSRLANYTTSSLIGQNGYNRYSVTFVDNHDTGRDNNNMLKSNIEAANAYILTMPGTPCVWLTHWQGLRTAIKRMILARQLAGITNQSKVLTSNGSSAGYSVSVEGTHGNLLLLLGNATASTDGYKLATQGENYKLYISSSIDISAIEKLKFQLPACATLQEGTYAYFEKPANWGSTLNVWAWYNNATHSNLYGTTEWPGKVSQKDITKVGTNDGHDVYLWKYSGTNAAPDMIIFNDGGNQTPDLTFRNGGYYTSSGLQGVVSATAISTINANDNVNDNFYDLQGRRVEHPAKGIYIRNGKKYVK